MSDLMRERIINVVMFLIIVGLVGYIVYDMDQDSSQELTNQREITALQNQLDRATSTTTTVVTLPPTTTTSIYQPPTTEILRPADPVAVDSNWTVINLDAGEALKLRNGPSTDDEILNEMPAGTVVVATGRAATSSEGARWIEVTFEEQVGWAYTFYLEAS